MLDAEAEELAALRDATNNTRVIVRGLQNHARDAVRLLADLEQRLALYDTRFQQRQRQRQAQEAQHGYETKHRTDPVRA